MDAYSLRYLISAVTKCFELIYVSRKHLAYCATVSTMASCLSIITGPFLEMLWWYPNGSKLIHNYTCLRMSSGRSGNPDVHNGCCILIRNQMRLRSSGRELSKTKMSLIQQNCLFVIYETNAGKFPIVYI